MKECVCEKTNEFDFSNIKGLYGNYYNNKELFRFLNDFKYSGTISEKSCICIEGCSGIGKTYAVSKICNYLKMTIVSVDYSIYQSNTSTGQKFTNFIIKTATSSLIEDISGQDLKKVILLDEFDNLCMQDKSVNSQIKNIIQTGSIKNIPFIIVSNGIADMIPTPSFLEASNIQTLKYSKLTAEDIFLTLRGLYPEAKCKFLYNISENVNGNISQAILRIDNNAGALDKRETYSYLFDMEDRECGIELIRNDIGYSLFKFYFDIVKEYEKYMGGLSLKKQHFHFIIDTISMVDLQKPIVKKLSEDDNNGKSVASASQLEDTATLDILQMTMKSLNHVLKKKKGVKNSVSEKDDNLTFNNNNSKYFIFGNKKTCHKNIRHISKYHLSLINFS
jgi:hypothetical protein